MSLLLSSIIDQSLQVESPLHEAFPQSELLLLEEHPQFVEAPVALNPQLKLISHQLGLQRLQPGLLRLQQLSTTMIK
jgi:hypothetical protein